MLAWLSVYRQLVEAIYLLELVVVVGIHRIQDESILTSGLAVGEAAGRSVHVHFLYIHISATSIHSLTSGLANSVLVRHNFLILSFHTSSMLAPDDRTHPEGRHQEVYLE